MHRRITLAMVAVAGATTLIAGCGSTSSGGPASVTDSGTSISPSASTGSSGSGGSAAPISELTNAVNSLGSAQTLTSTIKLGASASQLTAFAKANGGSGLTSSEASTIAGLSISVEASAPSGQTIGDLSGSTAGAGAVELTVGSGGKTYLGLITLNKTIYLQVDLKDLFGIAGKGSEFSQLNQGAAALPAFLQALLGGRWVSLSAASLKQLEGSVAPGTKSTASPQQSKKLLTALQAVLTKDVTVTKTSSGGTDDLTLTANSKTLVNDFLAAVGSTVPGASSLGSSSAAKVKSKTITLMAQVSGGTLTGLSLNLGQFAKKPGTSLPLVITFAKSGPTISAPSGAVPVDTSQLGSLASGLGGSL